MNAKAADDIVKACALFVEEDGRQSPEAIALAARLLAEFQGTFMLVPKLDANRMKLECGCDAVVIHETRCPEQILRKAAATPAARTVDPEVFPIARVAEEALMTAGFNADVSEVSPDGVTLVVSKPGTEKCFAVGVSLYPCFDPAVVYE